MGASKPPGGPSATGPLQATLRAVAVRRGARPVGWRRGARAACRYAVRRAVDGGRGMGVRGQKRGATPPPVCGPASA
jgi:hypothetical protein